MTVEPVSVDPRSTGLDREVGTWVEYCGERLLKRGFDTTDWVLAENALISAGLQASSAQYRTMLAKIDPAQSGSWRWHWADFTRRGDFTEIKANSGAVSAALGAAQLTSGVTGSSTDALYLGTANDYSDIPLIAPALASDGATTAWGIVGRMKITTTPDAQTSAYFGVRNAAGTAYLRIGAIGSLSTTNFVVDTETALGDLDTAVALDTAWHTFRAYRYGAKTYVEIDDVAVGNGAKVRCGANAGIKAFVGNGSTAAAQTIQIAWIGVMAAAV